MPAPDLTMLTGRLRKNLRKHKPWAKREQLTAYRLYDRDIPEFPLSIDRYAGDVLIYFYAEKHRPFTTDPQWQNDVTAAVASVVPGTIFTRERGGVAEDETDGEASSVFTVSERGHLFEVGLGGKLDTGLYLDHREARRYVASIAHNKRVLNLFAYTGTFSVYAACAGASRVVTVDGSGVYCRWAERNFALNNIETTRHPIEKRDVRKFLQRTDEIFDIVVLDPPTFSAKKGYETMDIQRDHVDLIKQCLARMPRNGVILFSTNRRRFQLEADKLHHVDLEETTEKFAPRDFRRYPRSWLITKLS